MPLISRGVDRKSAIIVFVLCGWVMSELAWVIRTDNKRIDFNRESKAEINVSKTILSKLQKGENVNIKKELTGAFRKFDENSASVDEILQNLENIDTKWTESSQEVKDSLKSLQKHNESFSDTKDESLPKLTPKSTSKGGWL